MLTLLQIFHDNFSYCSDDKFQSLDNFQGQYAFTLYDQNNDGKIDTEEAAIFINFITGLF